LAVSLIAGTFNFRAKRVIGNNLFSALKMSITAQSIDKSDGDNVEHSKVLLVKTFNAKIKCYSPLQDMVFSPIREFRCFYCTRQENGNFIN